MNAPHLDCVLPLGAAAERAAEICPRVRMLPVELQRIVNRTTSQVAGTMRHGTCHMHPPPPRATASLICNSLRSMQHGTCNRVHYSAPTRASSHCNRRTSPCATSPSRGTTGERLSHQLLAPNGSGSSPLLSAAVLCEGRATQLHSIRALTV